MTPLSAEQSQMVAEHIVYAKRFMMFFMRSHPRNDPEFVLAAAQSGLVEAARTFDPAKGTFHGHSWRRMWMRVGKDLKQARPSQSLPGDDDGDFDVPDHRPAPELPDERLQAALASLPERWKLVVIETIGIGRSLEDVARQLKVSKQCVHGIRSRAMVRLRKSMGAA